MFAGPMIKNGEEASGHALKFIGEARCPTFGSGAAFLLFFVAAKQQFQTSLRIRLGTKLATR
jgi:hypothetical protein